MLLHRFLLISVVIVALPLRTHVTTVRALISICVSFKYSILFVLCFTCTVLMSCCSVGVINEQNYYSAANLWWLTTTKKQALFLSTINKFMMTTSLTLTLTLCLKKSKIGPRHSLRRPRFRIRQMHFHYRVTFTGYILCFCATTSHDLVTLTFDLLTLRVFHVSASHARTTYRFLLSYDCRLLSYDFWIFDHISVIWNSHCACAVSRDLYPGAKIVHIFEIFDPDLPIHFATFRTLRRRLSNVICEK